MGDCQHADLLLQYCFQLVNILQQLPKSHCINVRINNRVNTCLDKYYLPNTRRFLVTTLESAHFLFILHPTNHSVKPYN